MEGSKTEQQCRTRGIIIYNKLRENNTDDELYRILAGKHYGMPYMRKEYVR